MSNVPQPIEHDLGGYISKAFDIYKQDLVNWIIIGVVGTFALGVGFLGGFHICAMKALSGQKPEVGDVLAPFNRIGEWILPILGLSAVAILLGWVCGLGIFIAIYFSLLWMWAWPLMYSQNQTWAQAKETSTTLVKSAMVPNFILMFVAGLVGGIGGIVGLNFLTAPLTGIILAVAYQAQFGASGGYGGPAALPGQGYGGPAPGAWGAPPAAAPADNNAWGAPPAAAPANNGWGAPAPTPAPADNNNAWGAPPAAAPAPTPWGAPDPTPAPADNNTAWGAPQAAAPAPTPWGAPAPTPAPADNNTAWGAPQAAAPAPTPWGAPAPTAAPPAENIESATQATTNNPDEIVAGKTMAMSTLDFEKMMAERNKPNS